MFDEDPIKSYGKSKFSKIFGDEDLSGGSENRYEYDGHDNESFEEQHRPAFIVTKYGINRTRGLSIQTVIVCFIITWICCMIGVCYHINNTINMQSMNEEMLTAKEQHDEKIKKQQEIKKAEEELNNYDFNTLKYISFEDGISIPTIYNSVNEVRKVKEQEYRYLDKRFGDGLTTIEIIYEEPFTEAEIDGYIYELIREKYNLARITYLDEYTFAKQIEGANKFLMVVIEHDRFVYGAGVGDYGKYISENKNIK